MNFWRRGGAWNYAGAMLKFWLPALVFSGVLSMRAENWPEFRGPTGQGHASAAGLPLEWSSSNNVAWKVSIPGEGWASPVLVDGRLYLTCAVRGDKLSLHALALDASDGKILWDEAVFAPENVAGIHQKNGHASPTPLVEGDRLYVHFGPNGTAALDLSGKVLWRNTDFHYPPVHGSGGSPVLVDDKLIFNCDAEKDPFVVALNKKDGTVAWKVNRESDAKKKFSFCTPLLIEVDGHRELISAGSNVVIGYDPSNGEEIWRVRYDGYSVVPRPVFGLGLIFMSTGFDHPKVLAIRAGGKGDVTDTHVAWTATKGAPNTPSLLLSGEELYMVADSGIVSCLDARSGEVQWQERIGGNCSASPVDAGDRLYVQNEEGVGVVLAKGREFKKLASNPLNERTLASYAIGDGAIFIRSASHLFRIQQASGKN